MTSEERLLAAFRSEGVDHTPCCPTFWVSKPDYQAFKWRDIDEQLRFVMRDLDADARLSFAINTTLPGQKTWEEHRPGEEYPILHSSIETPKGELHAAIRLTDDYPHTDIPLFSDWTVSRYVEPWIKTLEDAEKFAAVFPPRTIPIMKMPRKSSLLSK